MIIKASTLRRNLYQLLDQVLETGQPLIVEYKARRIQIAAVQNLGTIDKLKSHSTINGDPESLLNLDWSQLPRPEGRSLQGGNKM